MNADTYLSIRGRLQRALLVAAMALLSLNLITGSPLLAMWVGSRMQGERGPSIAGFGSAAVVLGAASYTLVWLLGRAGQAHDRLTGHRATVLKHVPWLRHARGERSREHGAEVTASALEIVLVLVVFLGVVAFEIWFFFYSTSPIDQRTGRG